MEKVMRMTFRLETSSKGLEPPRYSHKSVNCFSSGHGSREVSGKEKEKV